MTIKIAKEFTQTPGGRYRKVKFSGQEFREDILDEKLKSLGKDEVLTVDLDGTYGYPVSFLEEAFGGLVRELREKDDLETIEVLPNKLKFISEDQPSLIALIWKYIENAKK